MDTTTIEQIFCEHFRQQKYLALLSGSLVDDDIPMTFVMSVGFLQVERAKAEGEHFTLIQNCFRYFDLDTIGQDNLHLSFFRMAGAFTFGFLEREPHILDLWNLLTRSYQLPAEKLWATYFQGDVIDGYSFLPDNETRDAWINRGLPEDRVIGSGKKDNFWMQSRQMLGQEHAGKCGPNTELFYDLGAERSCGDNCLPGCRCGRFVEFLNLLFIAWNRNESGGQPVPLSKPFVEMAIGVERLAMLSQGVSSIFQTDSIQPLMQLAREYEQSPRLSEAERTRLESVLVDHLRALFYLVADGAPPPRGSGARGFIMRKLLRRMLTSMKLLRIPANDFLPVTLEKMPPTYFPSAYDVLFTRQKVLAYIAGGAALFENSIKTAQRMLDRVLLKQEPAGWISGEVVLKLEKEKGIPIELVNSWLQERNVQYSLDAYHWARETWQNQTRKSI